MSPPPKARKRMTSAGEVARALRKLLPAGWKAKTEWGMLLLWRAEWPCITRAQQRSVRNPTEEVVTPAAIGLPLPDKAKWVPTKYATTYVSVARCALWISIPSDGDPARLEYKAKVTGEEDLDAAPLLARALLLAREALPQVMPVVLRAMAIVATHEALSEVKGT